MQDIKSSDFNENGCLLLGFDSETVKKGTDLVKTHKKNLTDLTNRLKIFCSTPVLRREVREKVMEFYFSQSCNSEGNLKTTTQILDGDSGYVSHNQESNSESLAEESTTYCSVTNMLEDNIYISEDALLEKPELNSVSNLNENNEEENVEEYSHLFYFNSIKSDSIVYSSGGGGSVRTCLSGLDETSNVSSVIYPIDRIVISEGDSIINNENKNELDILSSTPIFEESDNLKNNEIALNSPVIEKFNRSLISPYKKKKNSSSLKKQQKYVDENKENDVNYLNFPKTFFSPTHSKNISSESTDFQNAFIKNKNIDLKLHTESTNSNCYVSDFETDVKNSFENSCLSPELFSDDETVPVVNDFQKSRSKELNNSDITKDEEILLKRTQNTLKGVLPPPSVTVFRISVDEILNKIHQNNNLFLSNQDSSYLNNSDKSIETCNSEFALDEMQTDNSSQNSRIIRENQQKPLLVNCKKEDINSIKWPEIMEYKYHGLLYNKSKFSEEFEQLCQKYAERYVGLETQSTCTVFSNEVSSPSKRRLAKLKRVGKSPGKRLSHLARRRITFSKDSLNSSNSFIYARSRQILIDARKQAVIRKSPRKTPRKSPRKTPTKKRTPSSVTKKRKLTEFLSRSNLDLAGNSYSSPSENWNAISDISSVASTSSTTSTSKRRTPRRALFTSPKKSSPHKNLSSFYSKKKLTPKRALFMSPEKEKFCDRKRKRSEDEDTNTRCKLSKSLSFPAHTTTKPENPKVFSRFNSTGSFTSSGALQNQELSEHRKKKLLWAVSEALRSQNITMSHPQFKVFASVLARVTRRLFPNNLNHPGSRPEGSTSELMLKIARQHVFSVTRGKTVEEILHELEKAKSAVKPAKPSGYVAPEENKDRRENTLRVIPSSSGILTQSNQVRNSAFRNEKVERIRRAINFSECEDDRENKNSNI